MLATRPPARLLSCAVSSGSRGLPWSLPRREPTFPTSQDRFRRAIILRRSPMGCNRCDPREQRVLRDEHARLRRIFARCRSRDPRHRPSRGRRDVRAWLHPEALRRARCRAGGERHTERTVLRTLVHLLSGRTANPQCRPCENLSRAARDEFRASGLLVSRLPVNLSSRVAGRRGWCPTRHRTRVFELTC